MNRKAAFFSITAAVTSALLSFSIDASLKGDANGDGKFNIRDAAYISSSISRGDTKSILPDGDFNGDGTINIRDAAAISKHFAEIKRSSPATAKTTTKKASGEAVTKTAVVNSKHEIVYITRTGKKYHYSITCNGGTYYPVKIDEALKKGLKPCNKCVL